VITLNNTTASSAYVGQNTSGTGKSAILPPEIKGWNWGAFWLTWIWGIRNKTWISFLVFIPFFNFVWVFFLGAKGNKWAWQNEKWESTEEFKKSQHRWAKWGLIIFLISISISIGFGAWAALMPYIWFG
jgi:hypothetical protein